MSELYINEGSYDELKLSEKRNDMLVMVSLFDGDMLINKSEAQQIIDHLKNQFEL